MAQTLTEPGTAAEPNENGKQTLRQRADAELRARQTEQFDALSHDQAIHLLQELQLHKIELELQNKDLQQTKEALELAYARYFDLYELAPVGYVTLNAHGLILEANRRAAELFGVARSALLKQPLSSFVHPDDEHWYLRHRILLHETRKPQTCEVRMHQDSTGGGVWARLEMAPGQDTVSGKEVCRMTLSDISAHKRIQTALEQSEERFRTLMERVTKIAVQGYAPDGTVIFWNKASQDLYGYTADQARGKQMFDLIIPPELQAETRRAIAQMAATGVGIPAGELELMRRDGSRVPVYSNHTVVEVSGRGKELYCLDIDLSESKRLQQALHDANQHLEEQLGELVQLHSLLRSQAVRDPLTQLYNRRYFNESLPREMARALRHDYTIGVLIMDLDHFKLINDTYGHLAGDETIQTVARFLTAQFRLSDILCRYGGEEFLCLIPNTTGEIAMERAQALRAALAELPVLASHPQVRVTASIGVALFTPRDDDMNAVLKVADDALYQAKAAGRNCVRRVEMPSPT